MDNKFTNPINVTAIVLAAGLSSRMGHNKLLLPWKSTTVIGWVITQLQKSGMDSIILVTGRDHEKIERETAAPGVRHIHNERFTDGEMLHSLQCGLSTLPKLCKAVLVVLGDQPFIEGDTVLLLLRELGTKPESKVIIPSYHNKRGHPILIAKSLFEEIVALKPPDTLRTFLNRHNDEINYVVVESSSVLYDLDTPKDYQRVIQ